MRYFKSFFYCGIVCDTGAIPQELGDQPIAPVCEDGESVKSNSLFPCLALP